MYQKNYHMQNNNQTVSSTPIYSDQNELHFPLAITTSQNVKNNIIKSPKTELRPLELHSTKFRSSSLTEQTTTRATILTADMNITFFHSTFTQNPQTPTEALVHLTHIYRKCLKIQKRVIKSDQKHIQVLPMKSDGRLI
jgi:hypothetical protein